MQTKNANKSRLKKILRRTFRVVIFLFLLLLLVCGLILVPPVQNFIKSQAVNYLEKKIDTKVAVDKIYIGFPKTVSVDGIYLEDQTGDTLLYAGKIRINIALFKLITGKRLDVESVELSDMTAKINRSLPDTSFNFRYIIDAFSSGEPPKEDAGETAPMPVSFGTLDLNNIRIVYKDVVTGYDADVAWEHFSTRFQAFDLQEMNFGVEHVNLGGLNAKIYQAAPLKPAGETIVDVQEKEQEGDFPGIQLGKIGLDKINLEYKSDVAGMYSLIRLGALNIDTKALDLEKQLIDVNTVRLDSTSVVLRLDKTNERDKAATPVSPPEEKTGNGWTAKLGALQLNDINLQFDDENVPAQKTGMDYMHLKAEALNLHAGSFVYNGDSIGGTITRGSLREKSGFELKELKADFLYASTQAYLKDLLIRTPGTELKRSLAIRYPSIEALQKDINLLQFNLDLDNSRVQVKDILTFVPALSSQPGFTNPDNVLYINSAIKGSVNNLQIPELSISGYNNTRVDISGTLQGLPDVNRLGANFRIRDFTTTKQDLQNLLPAGSLPDNITLPDKLQLTGNLKGAGGRLNTDIQLKSSLGNISLNGLLQEIADPVKAVYDITLQTQALDLGTLLQNRETLGPVTATLAAKGKGYDIEHADAVFSGKLVDAVVNNYSYKDLSIEGSIARQQARINAAIADPNIHITLDAAADLAQQYPALQLNVEVDSIKTQPLHFTKDALVYRGKITADFPVTNPDSLEGQLFILQSLLVHNQHRVELDSIQLLAGYKDSLRFIELKSDALYAQLLGKYRLTEMGGVIPQLIDPYFSMNIDQPVPVADFDFTVNASVARGPVLKAFVPDLARLDSMKLNSRFSSGNGWNIHMTTPRIDYGTTSVNNLDINVETRDSALVFNTFVQNLKSGESVQLYKSTIDASVAGNLADISVHLRDREEKEKYHFNILLDQREKAVYDLSLVPDSLLLHYQPWTAAADNRISFSPEDVNIHNFGFEKDGQSIKIQSRSAGKNAPIDVRFADFRVSTISGLIQSDSVGINGTINGNIELNNVTSQPVFAGDLRLDDLSVKKDTVGNVRLQVNNTIANTYSADLSVTGKGNDIALAGSYETTNNSFDMNLDIRTIPLTTVQVLSGGAVKDVKGSINGGFAVTGTIDQPAVNGSLNFNNAGLNISMLNNYFTVDQQRIQIDEEGIRFNRFRVNDSAGNALTLNGLAATTNFSNYKFDLALQANDFRALNSTKKDNKIFYGKLFFDADLRIRGTEAAPEIDGRLKINDKTAMTVVLPQEEPGVVEREGVVVFVDKDAMGNDSLFQVSYDSLNTTSLQGLNVSVNAEVDKEANFVVVVDEGSGDHLQVKGGAQLNVGIEPGGKVAMSGVYEINKGSYDFSFNLLKRKFIIEEDSRITWGGEPTDATVSITAKYTANTSPLDLVKNQLGAEVSAAERNTYLQKLPFDVLLKMEGELMRPRISFDIVLPDESTTAVSSGIVSNVRAKLDMMRQDEAEMNKQVFALLLLNRFVAEDPFSSSGGISTSTMVRQSVNKIMSDQLNRWAADLIKGVDINFDLESTEDYTTGERQDRTDLNVGLSKRMLDDRLTVTVGSNFELDGPQTGNNRGGNIAGNVNIQYRLTEDGRYMLRGYRNNEYQGIIEGYVVETGIGFTITMDYNRFREIFQKRRTVEDRKKRREERRQQKNTDKNQPDQS
ncbi:MAG: translocation/assembly module TamB domain-containing protein [Chitinophagaceae bacterium]|nr:translocation/assembly module TamB domain-containing protein [Chitinophagaceae bacterium]MCW5927821.1 translocation/assembly module TamB domain-containing protein [Chitinophagaceae bacterium]